MYNGHEYLSCIKINTKQAVKNEHRSEKAESMDLAAEHRDLISTANKVFGEGKWNHTIVNQTLDFVEIIGAKCCTGCVSFVKIQLENGNFHEDIGYYSAEESTKGLSIHNARVGSAVNALRRVLLSFGDKIEKELQQLQRQIDPGQANNIQKSVIQSNEQIPEKSNVSVKVLQTECTSEPELNKNANQLIKASSLGSSTVNNSTTEANQSSPTKIKLRLVEPSPKKIKLIGEIHKVKALSASEIQRVERKRKQLEKQLEFKMRMRAKEELVSANDNKPNPKY